MSDTAETTIPDLLARLEDIAVPEPVSWMPQTTAWAFLAAALSFAAIAMAIWALRRWRANRYRREALHELGQLEARWAAGDPSAAASVATLLRRVALQIAPRESVASLAGDAWLGFLDDRVKGELFRSGVGRRLLDLAYAPAEGLGLEGDGRAELLARARRWIRFHRA